MKNHNRKQLGFWKFWLGFGLMLAVSMAKAGETRIIEAFPSTGKTTVGALAKAKAQGFECFKVKLNEKGNATKVKNTKSMWFDLKSVPETSDAADNLLADGKIAIKCSLKEYRSGKFRSADLDSIE